MLDYEENGLGLEDQENEDLGMEDNQDYGDEHLYDENEDGFTASDDPMMPEGEMTFVDTDGDGYTETTVITYDDINEDGVVRVQEIHSDTDGDGIDDYHAQYVELDTDGSGEVDTVVGEIDTDGDGVVDRIEQYADTNNSGEFDTKYAEYDSDGDGLPDTAILANDYDQDGNPDNVKIYTDENRDGRYDTMEKQFDSTGDGELDSTEYYVDENADEPVDYDQMYDYDSETNTLVLADDYDEIAPEDLTPEEYEKLMYLLSIEQYDPSTVSDPDMIIGNPDDSLEYWQEQGGNGPCALYAQMFVIEELTGEDINIDDFIQEASDNGWYYGDGTTALNMDQMLDYYGVDHEMGFNKSIDDIVECLDNGGKVIVSVDADQMWYGDETDIFSPESGANHAVEVIGIDNSDPSNPMVILNDSGIPMGQGEKVPLEVFENAWNEGDRQMIECYPS